MIDLAFLSGNTQPSRKFWKQSALNININQNGSTEKEGSAYVKTQISKWELRASVIVSSSQTTLPRRMLTKLQIMKIYTRNGKVVREKDAMKDVQNIHAQKILV